MYTMVLMMAASSAGESPDFFHRKSAGCTGTVVAAPAGCIGSGAGCTGTVVAAPAGCIGTYAGCTGSYAGCMGSAAAGCTGSTGERGGFLGLRGRLFGNKSGCHGTAPVAPACCPAPIPAPACCDTTTGTVLMPGVPAAKPMTMPEVKKDEPKKDEPKKGSES